MRSFLIPNWQKLKEDIWRHVKLLTVTLPLNISKQDEKGGLKWFKKKKKTHDID